MAMAPPANQNEPGVDARTETARLFIALWPGPDLASALHALCGVCATDRGARVVAPQKLHLTLHFLGTVPRQRLPALACALQVPFEPFELRLSHCEAWPHGLRVAVPDTAVPPLIRLHAALGQALQGLGLPLEERPFRPHLTLARRSTAPLPTPEGPALRWPVSGYVLVESQAARDGAYQVVQAYS
jgi:2'-5' RNA ligase